MHRSAFAVVLFALQLIGGFMGGTLLVASGLRWLAPSAPFWAVMTGALLSGFVLGTVLTNYDFRARWVARKRDKQACFLDFAARFPDVEPSTFRALYEKIQERYAARWFPIRAEDAIGWEVYLDEGALELLFEEDFPGLKEFPVTFEELMRLFWARRATA